ncbi:MAG TPA: hypothetical protein VHN18_15460, partial [Micromonosporaceae bacterium]|nr:hypothetical protein [Micromonosporaceae bacterium]
GLPGWFARGRSAGEVPRRSLAVVAGLSALSLTVVAVGGVEARPLVLITTGAFVLVYLLGTAAAVRLLPRGTLGHRGAVVALVAVAALVVMTGVYMLWALVLAAGALLYERRQRRRMADRQPVLVDAAGRT